MEGCSIAVFHLASSCSNLLFKQPEVSSYVMTQSPEADRLSSSARLRLARSRGRYTARFTPSSIAVPFFVPQRTVFAAQTGYANLRNVLLPRRAAEFQHELVPEPMYLSIPS